MSSQAGVRRQRGGRWGHRPGDRRALCGARRRGAGTGARRLRRHRRDVGHRVLRARGRGRRPRQQRGDGRERAARSHDARELASAPRRQRHRRVSVHAGGDGWDARARVAAPRHGRLDRRCRAGAPYTAAYTAAKHAAVGLMRVAAAELTGSGVTANPQPYVRARR